MTQRTVLNTAWWMLYPLKGFEITDERHDLLEPMFGDATILSKAHIRDIIPMMKLNERGAPGHDHEHDVVYLLQNATFREDFQSFVAVRRTGSMALDATAVENPADLELASGSANRAYQIAALLALVFLARSSLMMTCGLVEQIHRQNRSVAMIDLAHGALSFQAGGGSHHSILVPQSNIRVSRSDLGDMLAAYPFAGLTKAILPQNSALPRSLRRAVSQAAIRLSDAVHATTPTSQLLGAVTSIEILVTEQGDSYEFTKRRLAALLGDETIAQYRADAILRARHLYVHRGQPLEQPSIALSAIRLALSCLLRYCEAVGRFVDRPLLIKYLDFISKADSLAEYWSESEQLAFSTLLKHKREGFKLPFATDPVKRDEPQLPVEDS